MLMMAGCQKIYSEQASGTKTERTELAKLLDNIRPGDTLVVYSLDRLGRTVLQLVDLMTRFKKDNIHLKSLTEGSFDTNSVMGEAIFQIIAVLKSMEVSILRERTRSGLAAAKARGHLGGRPKDSYDKIKSGAALSMFNKGTPVASIAKTLSVSRTTLYTYLKREGVDFSINVA